MKIGKKHTKSSFMTKPREGWLFRTSEYILNDPEALYILLLLSHLFAVLFFGTLFVVFIINNASAVLKVLFLMGTGFSGYKLVKYLKFRKTARSIMGNMNINELVFHKKK